MPYIGRQLTQGNFIKLDDLQSQFNGTTTTFSLTAGCIDQYHESYRLRDTNNKPPFTVAIVDDVITTGVTVNLLSKLLKARYPNIHIQVWAMTFTPPPKSTLLKDC